jgi:hypothetical protein
VELTTSKLIFRVLQMSIEEKALGPHSDHFNGLERDSGLIPRCLGKISGHRSLMT